MPSGGIRSDLPDGLGGEEVRELNEMPRPEHDRFQRIKTGLTIVRIVLWLGWLLWVSSSNDHDVTC